jgi:hypothetical protein
MRFYLDHVIVAVRDLEHAAKDWEGIGLVATDGGIHPRVGTRNTLVRFPDRSFLELMAIDDRDKLQTYAPVLLTLLERHADGPFSWSLRTDDIEGARRALLGAGLPALEIWPGEARRASGKVARWRSLHVQEAGFPFLVQYESEPTSGPSTTGLPAIGLGAVLMSGPRTLLMRFATAFDARLEDARVLFHGGSAELEGSATGEPAILGVELLVSDVEQARRKLGPVATLGRGANGDDLAHGLAIRLAAIR